MSRAERERAVYAQVVAAMDYPEPSTLLHRLAERRSRNFARDELLSTWRQAAAEASDEAAWNLYVHVPYCKSICSFCNYKRLRVSSREALDRYVDFLAEEARVFGEALEGARFGALYVGGGTPSVLSADQLERLFAALFERFAFHEGAQKNFEFDPMVMTPDRFATVRRHGFSRFSFGIQSVDVEVNALHNRGRQRRSHLERQFALLGEHGGATTNVDFLLGLARTSPDQMIAEIDEVLSRHRPHEVSIYFLYPTPAYVAQHFEGSYDRFREFLAPFEERVPRAIRDLAERLSYRVGGDGKHVINLSSAGPADLRPTRAAQSGRYFYCDVPSQAHRPLYVLGLGDSARSRIFGRLTYKSEIDDGLAEARDLEGPSSGPARYPATFFDRDDEMFGYLALSFRDGDTLSRPLFRRTFGRDVVEAFAPAIAKLTTLGALSVAPEALTMVPQPRNDRLRDILFFLPPSRRRELAADPRLAVPA
jgi:hypothetical protein